MRECSAEPEAITCVSCAGSHQAVQADSTGVPWRMDRQRSAPELAPREEWTWPGWILAVLPSSAMRAVATAARSTAAGHRSVLIVAVVGLLGDVSMSPRAVFERAALATD